jgi:hypothetical protein
MDKYFEDMYFEDTYRRNCRKMLADFFYQKINNIPGPYNHIWAFVIKSIHFTGGFMAGFIYLFGPMWLSLITLVVSLFFWGLFLYLNGCFVSNVEYKLDSTNFINVIDPYLVIFGYPINEETRYSGTLHLVVFYFSAAFTVLYLRLKMRNFIKN